MTASLECVLIVFLITLITVLIILCIYLAKLLEETSKTMKSLNELAELARKELEPAMESANNILKAVDGVRKIPLALLGVLGGAFTALKGKGGFLSGLASGFNLVKKRRK